MPCYDDRDSPSNVKAAAMAEFRHNSDVAEMLCSVLKDLPHSQFLSVSPETMKWWIEHQERDKNKAA